MLTRVPQVRRQHPLPSAPRQKSDIHPPLQAGKRCVSYRFFTLPMHAAHKSGSARRKPGTGFSDAISGALGRLAAQSSGAKNLVSTRFFTLPKHAGALQCEGIVNEKFAFQSLSYMDFEISDFSLTSEDVCAPAQTSGVKNIVSTIFFTLPWTRSPQHSPSACFCDPCPCYCRR